VAIHFGNIDRPVGLKIHKHATPLMGGVAVFGAFVVASLVALPLSHPVVGLLAGGCVAVCVGVLDEKFSLPPLVHLLGHITAAAVAIVAGLGTISSISLPFASLITPGYRLPAAVGLGLTVVWLVGMMNTINFLDGLDGLVTGVSAEVALLLAIWASESDRFFLPASLHHEDLLLPLALLGALLGFLPFNWHVARIFLGDSGAMFIGLAIGSLAIVGPAKLGTALLVLIIPVLDVAWAIVRRQLRGRSFLAGDKQHVYHRMLEFGLSHTHTVISLYALVALFGILDLILVKAEKFFLFLLLAAVTVGTFILLESRTRGDESGGARERANSTPASGTDRT
jgi:UDP-GlcNAc:undecaprenyl-phosphate/decaprenyl-phosphate GlcNAc-1-phosphate transferase